MIEWIILALVTLTVLAVAGAAVAWKMLGGRKLARQARLLIDEQVAASGPHQAVVRWRRALDDALTQTRRVVEAGRRADTPMADVAALLARLERGVASLDQELALLAGERDPAMVDYCLRSDVGVRADRALQLAGQLRRAVTSSLASGNAENFDDLASSAELSTRALSAALEELARRRPPG